MKLKARYVGAGDEYRLIAEVGGDAPGPGPARRFPQPEKLDREEEWLDVPLERLRAYDRAPSNPRWLRDAGVEFSFTTEGLEEAKDFPQARPRGDGAGSDGRRCARRRDDGPGAPARLRRPARYDRGGQDRQPRRRDRRAVRREEPRHRDLDRRRRERDFPRTRRKRPPRNRSRRPSPETAPKTDVRPSPAREAGPLASPSGRGRAGRDDLDAGIRGSRRERRRARRARKDRRRRQGPRGPGRRRSRSTGAAST